MIVKHTIFLLLLIAAAQAFLTVDTNTNQLKDEYNRIRIFHGVNAIYKEFPYYPLRN